MSYYAINCTTGVYDPKYKTVKRRNEMNIFKVFLVDKVNCEVLVEKTVVANDESGVLFDFALTEDQKKKLKRGDYEVVTHKMESFERITATRVLNVKED